MHVLVDVMACLSAACVHACLCLARALHDGAGLDDAVELEAAVLVDGRHDVDAGIRNLEVLYMGRVQLHASRADGHGFGGRVLAVQCRCHVGGGSHIHGQAGGVDGGMGEGRQVGGYRGVAVLERSRYIQTVIQDRQGRQGRCMGMGQARTTPATAGAQAIRTWPAPRPESQW